MDATLRKATATAERLLDAVGNYLYLESRMKIHYDIEEGLSRACAAMYSQDGYFDPATSGKGILYQYITGGR